jgi:hypothetical protein
MDLDRKGETIMVDSLARLYWNGRPGVNRHEHGQLVRVLAKAIKRYRVQWEDDDLDTIRLVYPSQIVMED